MRYTFDTLFRLTVDLLWVMDGAVVTRNSAEVNRAMALKHPAAVDTIERRANADSVDADPLQSPLWDNDDRDQRRTVLVAVLNNHEDFRRIANEGWYRIPQRRAPDRVGADFLAFYQTSAFADAGEANTIAWIAPTQRYKLATRAELIPEERDHPRSNDYYFRIELGTLQRLAHPVPATTWRRLTFIHTTLGALLRANDVKDLVLENDPYDTLWDALRKNKLRPLRNRLVGDQPVDIALKARGGTLGINCRDLLAMQEDRSPQLPERWQLLVLSSVQIEQDLNGCLRQIGAALLNLGGSVLNA
jgi:hypothetical protein